LKQQAQQQQVVVVGNTRYVKITAQDLGYKRVSKVSIWCEQLVVGNMRPPACQSAASEHVKRQNQGTCCCFAVGARDSLALLLSALIHERGLHK